MIFVAVGTQKFQLNRLLKQLDLIIGNGSLQEMVFAQTGHSDYKPVHFSYRAFLTKEEFETKITQCDLLITHSGVGTIISGLKQHKKVIVFPRLAAFGEHVDDHQVQIAQAFSEQGFVLLCEMENMLLQTIDNARSFTGKTYHSQRNAVIDTIRAFIQGVQ